MGGKVPASIRSSTQSNLLVFLRPNLKGILSLKLDYGLTTTVLTRTSSESRQDVFIWNF